MNTIKLTRTANNVSNNESGIIILISKGFNKQADHFEATRFGMMAMYIVIQSCLASIACMYVLQANASIWQLCTCASLAMASNAVFIAQGSSKMCMATFYLSLVVNSILILMNV